MEAQQQAPSSARRPEFPVTRSQTDTQYVNMLLALDSIPRLHNMLAGFSTWILLAGFILFPGTFTSLQGVEANLNETEARVLDRIKNLPLFVIAWICCGIGAIGMSWLWWRWMNNYVWLVERIFLPGLLNAFAGIVSTLVGVYGQQNKQFSTASKITIAVTGAVTVICGALTLMYGSWKLAGVKRKHDQEIGKERAGKHGEGLIEQVKRKAQGTESESGMV